MVLLLTGRSPTALNKIVKDIRRAWYSSLDYVTGSVDVGVAVDPEFICKKALGALRLLGRTFEKYGATFSRS